MCESLAGIASSLKSFAEGFDPALISLAQAELVIRDASSIKNIAGALVSLAAARSAEGPGASRRRGYRSSAEELAKKAGTSLSSAEQAIETGRRLRSLPEVSKAARRGELSAEQAGLISLGAEADPSSTERLLERARVSSLGELKDEVARTKAAATSDPEERERQIHAKRRLRTWVDSEGTWHIFGLGSVAGGAQVDAALQAFRDAIFEEARLEGRREHPDAYGFDALVALAEEANSKDVEGSPPRTEAGTPGADDSGPSDEREGRAFLRDADEGAMGAATSRGPGDAGGGEGEGGEDGENGGGSGGGEDGGEDGQGAPRIPLASEPASRPSSSQPPGPGPAQPTGLPEVPAGEGAPSASKKRLRRGAPVKLLVRVDYDALVRGVAFEGELCELAGYGPVPVSLVERLVEGGDPFIVAIMTRGESVVASLHLGRRPTALQMSVLDYLYPTCAAEGCTARWHLETDHRAEWSKTHVTALGWLDRLCRFHHRLKTTEGWALVEGTGKRPFVSPDDPRHPRYRSPPPAPVRGRGTAPRPAG